MKDKYQYYKCDGCNEFSSSLGFTIRLKWYSLEDWFCKQCTEKLKEYINRELKRKD